MFSDRIENLSRGTIPPGQTMEGFFAGESVPVNQKLSDMLLQLHISERIGRGVPKITEVYGKGTYEFRENSIVVSIPFTRVSTEDEDPRWIQDRTQMELKKIVRVVRSIPDLTGKWWMLLWRRLLCMQRTGWR